MKIEVTADGVVMSELYIGVIVDTPTGKFGICQRDDGLVINRFGGEVYNSNSLESTTIFSFIKRLHEDRDDEFQACKDAEQSTYLGGYLQALEDVMELMK